MAQFVHGHLSVFAVRFILFTIVLAQLADAFTFTIGVSRFGIELESNGIASGLFRAGGFAAILSLKGAVVVVTVSLLAATAARFPRLLMWGGATATSLGLLGFVANTTSILLLS